MLGRAVLFCTRNPWRFLVVSVLGSLLLAALHLALVRLTAGLAEPMRGACWIWTQDSTRAAEPVAFWAVRDLQIDSLEGDPISVILNADEAYELWVNGTLVGSGAYRQDGPAHRYDLSGLVDIGLNRFLVELRSSRGAGGFVLSLRRGDEVLMGTDDRWRIFRDVQLGLKRGSMLLDDGESPKVWSRSATGRFRLTGVEDKVPFARSVTLASKPAFFKPLKLRHLSDLDSWQLVAPMQGRIPARQTVFDFGESISGILQLRFAEAGEAGLLFFDAEEPHAAELRPDVVVSPFPGRREWRDVRPRQFRYLATVGLPALRQISVLPVDIDARDEPRHGFKGVFGLPPAKPYLPVEEAVWDRLRNRAASDQRTDSQKSSS